MGRRRSRYLPAGLHGQGQVSVPEAGLHGQGQASVPEAGLHDQGQVSVPEAGLHGQGQPPEAALKDRVLCPQEG